MDNRLSIGVLGCAGIADRSVIPAIKGLANLFILTGVASRNSTKACQFAAKFDTRAYSSYDSLLELNNLDAVYIPLPNAMHKEWIEKALRRNLHVLVEKSLACTYDDIFFLNTLAKRKHLALIENFQFRFHSQLSHIKQILCSGAIGDLRCLRSSFGFPLIPSDDNIRLHKDLGGGALLDAGAYPVKIAQYFLGNDLVVAAANLAFDSEKKVDIWGGAYLQQKAGTVFAELAFGFDNFYQCSLELWGSKGRIYTNRIFTAPVDYAPEILFETNNRSETIKLEPDNHFDNMLRHFHHAVTSGMELKSEYIQNINQGRLVQEIREIAHGK